MFDFGTVRFEFGTYSTVRVIVFFDKNPSNDFTSHGIFSYTRLHLSLNLRIGVKVYAPKFKFNIIIIITVFALKE